MELLQLTRSARQPCQPPDVLLFLYLTWASKFVKGQDELVSIRLNYHGQDRAQGNMDARRSFSSAKVKATAISHYRGRLAVYPVSMELSLPVLPCAKNLCKSELRSFVRD